MFVKIIDPHSKYYGQKSKGNFYHTGYLNSPDIYHVATEQGTLLFQSTQLKLYPNNCWHCGENPIDCIDAWEEKSCWQCVYDSSPATRLEHLYQKANELCRHHWNVEFTGKIRISKRRWKRAWGLYYSSKKEIVLNLWFNSMLPIEKIYGTLLHELVHWKLHLDGKPYDDKDDCFIEECKRVGAPFYLVRKKTKPSGAAARGEITMENKYRQTLLEEYQHFAGANHFAGTFREELGEFVISYSFEKGEMPSFDQIVEECIPQDELYMLDTMHDTFLRLQNDEITHDEYNLKVEELLG